MILPAWTAMMRCKRSMRHLVHHESTSVPGLFGLVVMNGGTDKTSMPAARARPHRVSRMAASSRSENLESRDFENLESSAASLVPRGFDLHGRAHLGLS